MDQNFRKRLQKTLYCGELEPDHCPLALTELAVEYFQDLAPHKLDYVDLQSASAITSQETVSPSSVAMSMVYAKRLQRKRPDYVTKMSSSDLFIISMMMASKYLYDEGVDEEVFNDEWAENTGLETDEVNNMEMDFLDALDWELYIRKEDFDQAMLLIEKRVALREGLKRGWFSYTDLHLLLGDTWMQLLGSDMGLEWLQVVVVSSAAYMAGIMTMVGSTVLVTHTAAGLTSTGLLSALLPAALYTSPAALPALPLVLCPHLMAGCPPDLPPPPPPPPVADLGPNETRQVAEEEEEKSRSEDEARMPGQTVVDTILSQLMAVLTLKSHLAQFVYAVSDSCGYGSGRGDRNHSERNGPCYNNADCCPGTQEEVEEDDRQTLSTSTLMSRFFGMEEKESGWFLGSCSKCGKLKAPQPYPASVPSLSSSSLHCCCESKRWEGWKEDWGGMSGPVDKPCHEICPLYCCRAEAQAAQAAQSCRNQAMATTHSLFPDIIIGFSTSMPPPVFAA